MKLATDLTRCSGHCCREFTLSYKADELQEFRASQLEGWRKSYAEYLSGDRSVTAQKDWDALRKHYIDNVMITRMVKPTRYGKVRVALRNPGLYDQMDRQFYTCKNVEPNGNCRVYADRPYMCREYPNKTQCEWKACTWKYARNLPLPAGDVASQQGEQANKTATG